MSLKEKYQKYTIQDWIALMFGSVIMGIQIYRYATSSLGDGGLEVVVFGCASMLMFYPKLILDLIRKARGIETK
ncbi:hypothetical protein OAB94_02340 [Flavobacteriaceae bacterium]|nr:hypothetical protein [Flavobacteriaceae bacterium]